MKSTIQLALQQSNPDMGWLSQAELIPGFLAALKDTLYEQAETLLLTYCIVRLLATALQGASGLSLGAFRKFTMENLCLVISNLQTMENITVLNLSHLELLDKTWLQKILRITPVLQSLYLMETPRISIASVLSLLHDGSFRVASLYHSDLFRLPPPYLENDQISNLHLYSLQGRRLEVLLFKCFGSVRKFRKVKAKRVDSWIGVQ